MKKTYIKLITAVFCCLLTVPAFAAADKPNILVIMEDDIGIPNISHLSFGMMGYKTPNIDRIAREGKIFTIAGINKTSICCSWQEATRGFRSKL